MRIEKPSLKDVSAHLPLEHAFLPEEVDEPYDLLGREGEEDDILIGMLDSQADLFSGFEIIDNFQLSEEEEMLLDFLLPGRREKQARCMRAMSYQQFLVESIREYQSSLAQATDK